MNTVLLANSNPEESARLADIISRDYTVTCINSPDIDAGEIDKFNLLLLDHNFTEASGIDFLMQILKEPYLPVLIITPLNDPQCAIEALRAGAYNYIVEAQGYEQILTIAIREAIIRFNEREEMKQTIMQLRSKVDELEVAAGLKKAPAETVPPITNKAKEPLPEPKAHLLKEIISRFKRGDINLPPVPGVITKFNETIKSGASIPVLADILKKDVGISTKLINVSNSTYYRGATENKNLEDAINRLGLRETRQYVYAIANRTLYTSSNSSYKSYFEKLWLHSLACAYGTQAIVEMQKLQLKADPFTLGLLHDVGILILLEIIGELALKEKEFDNLEAQAIYPTIFQLHGKFGAVLLKRWNFQQIFIEVAMHHDHPQKAKTLTKELVCVNMANMLAKEAGFSVGPDDECDILGSQSAALLKIDKEQLTRLTAMVVEQIGTFSSILTN